jgi:hypothetical protein
MSFKMLLKITFCAFLSAMINSMCCQCSILFIYVVLCGNNSSFIEQNGRLDVRAAVNRTSTWWPKFGEFVYFLFAFGVVAL